MMKDITLELKKRFLRDNDIPIQILEEPYFTHFLEIYEEYFQAKTRWEKLWTEINRNFEGNPGKYLDFYFTTRNKIIEDIEKSSSYREFIGNQDFFNIYQIKDKEQSKDLYTENSLNKIFLQVDLKKANFQALKYYDTGEAQTEYYKKIISDIDLKLGNLSRVQEKYKKSPLYGLKKLLGNTEDNKDLINSLRDEYIKIQQEILSLKKREKILSGKETYEDFISTWTTSESFITSKHLRQVILGKLKPKRQITIEEYIVSKIINLISPMIPGKIYSRITDEVIYELSGDVSGDLVQEIIDKVRSELGIIVTSSVFTLSEIQAVTTRNSYITGFIKNYIYPEKSPTLHKIPGIYYAQIYKLWKGQEIEENDLVFNYEDQVAMFKNKLWLKS